MGLNKNQNSGNFNGEVGDMSNYATKSDLSTKVTKETNKSLVDDALIDKLEGLENYDDSLVKEEINDINSQLEQKANFENTTDWINVVSLGVDNTNTIDCSDKINQIIEENQGKTIFMPRGNYKVLSPIIVDGVDLVCDGVLLINDNIGLHLTSSYTNIKVKKIMGSDFVNRKGVGIKVGSDEKLVTSSHIEIGMITECETALLISPNNEFGVQCSTFEFNALTKSTYGIKIQGGDNGMPWVNENKFICRGSLNCEYGVYSKKGKNMIDPYNGNKFINLSIEQCKYPFVLEYMNSNIFTNIRCAESENGIVDYIYNLSSCILNTFTSNIPTSITLINEENCNNNLYDFIVQRESNGTYIGKSLKTHNGIKFLNNAPGIAHSVVLPSAYNKTVNTSDYLQKIKSIELCSDTNQSSILILDDRYGVDGGDYNEFLVNIPFANGSIEIKNSKGDTLLNQDKLSVGKHLIKYIGGEWYSFKAN